MYRAAILTGRFLIKYKYIYTYIFLGIISSSKILIKITKWIQSLIIL